MQQTTPARSIADLPASSDISFDHDAENSDAFSLASLALTYWQAIIKRRFLIAAIFAVSLGAGVILTMLQAPLYTAQSQLQISREQKNITNVQGLDQVSNPYDAEFYETQFSLMKARSLAERIVRDLKLDGDSSFFTAHGIEVSEGGGKTLSNDERMRREDLAARLILRGVKIDPVKNSSLVNVSYTSRSPQWSARMANAWPQEFINANMDRQFSSTADARTFLEQHLQDLRAKLDESENTLIEFGNSHNIVKLGGGRDAQGHAEEPRTLVASNLEALNAALVQARTDRIAAQSRTAAGAGAYNSDVLQNSSINSLRSKREELAGDYARLLVQFEPDYPAARALKSQMDALDAAIVRETARVGSGRQASYAEAVNRENELASQVRALKAQFDQQQRDTIQYNVYQREVDTNRQLYDALLQRYKEIGIAGTVGATNIVIVDQAKVPGAPSSPNLERNLLISLLIGLALSTAVVLGLEQMDQSVRDPDDVEKLLRLPLLGSVPKVEGEPLTEFADPKTALSEAYQSIRATMSFATNHGFPRSLVVTSSQAREGKSTTAFALAMAISRIGKRALLIDADMRSPSIHEIVGLGNERGLSNLLAGEDNSPALIIDTDYQGLSILPAGPTPPNPADLLSLDRLRELIDSLLQRYDYILIDGPPVLGLADAPLLSSAVEGCILVAEAEKTPVAAMRNSLHRLQQANCRIFGAILTKLDLHRYRYGYGLGYDYGYGYGQSSEKGAKAA